MHVVPTGSYFLLTELRLQETGQQYATENR